MAQFLDPFPRANTIIATAAIFLLLQSLKYSITLAVRRQIFKCHYTVYSVPEREA